MKFIIAIAALTLVAAPVQADVQHHSFPNVGLTGTYCSTYINGSYGSTSCSRGLTDAEMAADKARYSFEVQNGAKRMGLQPNHCEALITRKSVELKPYLSSIRLSPNLQQAEIDLCKGNLRKGKPYTAWATAQNKADSGCDPVPDVLCLRNGVIDSDFRDVYSYEVN